MIRAVAIVIATAACAALTGSALAASPVPIAPDSPGCVVRGAPPKVGVSELSRTKVDDRLVELRLHSDAMQGTQPVNVLLPKGYDPSGRTRYPVLYLLHGAFGSYADWSQNGVKDIVGDLPLIVVMPDDGKDGSYSDWYGMLPGATDPIPSWETYHLSELVPFVDAHFPTLASRRGRSVAGLSSGGAGAMKYAAAHPGLFGAAGEFSGAVDTDLDYPQYPTISEALWLVTLIPGYGPDGHCTWGDPYTQRVNWLDNTATYLAQNLKGTPLFLASGNGDAGPYDSGPTWDPTEYEVGKMNEEFAKALDAADIPHTDEFYGPGTHTWPYWKRDLTHFLTWLKPRLGARVDPPAKFSLRSARPAFSAWGWRFKIARDVREFAYLRDIGFGGFTVTGSGGLSVVTARLYKPGRRYTVDMTPGEAVTETADAAGRLHLHVDLGPSHQSQQYEFDSEATKDWRQVRVVISR